MSHPRCRQRTCSSVAAARVPKRPCLMPHQMIPGLEQSPSRLTDFADGASRMSPALRRVRDEPGLSVLSLLLLLLFQPAFFLRSTLGRFLMFPFSFVFFSLITHIRFSLLENNRHQNIAQKPTSENQVQGIVAARAGQRPNPAAGNRTLLARGPDPRRACLFAARPLTVRPAAHIARGLRGAAFPAAPTRPTPPGDAGLAAGSPRRRRDESVAFRA